LKLAESAEGRPSARAGLGATPRGYELKPLASRPRRMRRPWT